MTASELQQVIRALPPLPELAERFTWLFRRKDLRKQILEANPEEFLTWPVVRECMFVGNAPYIDGMASSIPPTVWNRIDDPGFGKPEFWNERTSGNLINQAFHLSQIGCNVSDLNSIVEFGAGYGAMAFICHRLGFHGTYTISDLPEFMRLQEYYLSNVAPELKVTYGNGNKYDLLIAICSLSEVDIGTRSSFLERTEARSYLIVFQPQWQGVDNMKYFLQLRDDNPQLEWRMYPNPFYQNHWYLIGRANDLQ